MNNRQHFEFIKNTLGDKWEVTAEDRVMSLVNILIDALYIPVDNGRTVTIDKIRIEHFGIDFSEPINWGDLKCNEALQFSDGTFLVTIYEASPNDCPTLCEYIEEFMASNGWIVKAETEW